jgi:putative ABC transport system permease protein
MIALARWLLSVVLPADARAAVLTELDAEYARTIRPSRGSARAAAWYWRQSAGSIGPAIGMRARRLLRLSAEAGQDLRFGARMVARQKTFTVAAVATLALGIGANTAIFSVVDGVLLRPLPYHESSRLVRVWSANPRGIARNGISPPDYFDWRDQARGFEALAAFGASDVTLTSAGDPGRLRGASVTANLAETLGVRPLLGRWIVPEETRGPGQPVVVVSERLWRDRLSAAPDIVGRSIVLDGRARTIVGVMPAGFQFPTGDERVWLPLPDSWLRDQPRGAHFLGVVGRLGGSMTLEEGREALRLVAKRLETVYPDSNRGWSVTVVPLREALVGAVRTPLLVLLAAVASVLLIACANVMSLMLARGVARARELAVRAAVGASAGRLVRQQMVEAALLATLGGGAGVALAWWGLRALQAAQGLQLPLLDRVTLDARVMAVAIALSLASAVVAGLVPAWKASRQSTASALGAGPRTTGDHVRVRQAIVFAQIAIATMLVAGGTVLLRSFYRLTAVPSGFTADRTVLLDVSLPGVRYPSGTHAAFYDRALERIRALPGVQAAGAGAPLPLSGQDGLLRFGVSLEGRAPSPDRPDRAYLRWATPQYFTAMGIALRAGRQFADADTAASRPVAVIDEALARRFFGSDDPIGRRIMISMEARRKTWREVVGVVAAVRQTALDREADPHVYVPQSQLPSAELTLVVRATGPSSSLAAGVRGVIANLDADLPVANVRSLADLVSGSTASRRFNALLLSLFAAVALLLTLVGVYGVVSQLVAQSTREIGVRIAIGASAGDVMSVMVGRALRMAIGGVAAGSLAAWLAAPALAGMVYGIAPRDPVTLIAVPLLLMAAAALAAYIPARGILRLDVVHALRTD